MTKFLVADKTEFHKLVNKLLSGCFKLLVLL